MPAQPWKETFMTAISYYAANVDGLKIFYREAGQRDAPTLLLLHGFPSADMRRREFISLLGGVAARRERAAVGEAADHRVLGSNHSCCRERTDHRLCAAACQQFREMVRSRDVPSLGIGRHL
jgi:hypothetical protein